jgi:uncharacterized repeat protein (TIGR03806 family)
MRRCIALASLALLAACAREAPATEPLFHAEGYPERLSEWRLMTAANGALTLSKGATPYDLATPLFSDYALKLRTVTLPKGEPATYNPRETFDLPVGTILSKTFYYPQAGGAWTGDVSYGAETTVAGGVLPLAGLRLIETRLLVHRAEGWVAIPYVWNEEQTDAVIRRTGEVKKLTLRRPDGRAEPFAYVVPNQNQCAGCHATNNTTRKLAPIGLKARHLNKPSTFEAGVNQLDHWILSGMLAEAPSLPSPASGRGDGGEGVGNAPHPESADADSTLSRERERVFPRNASWTDESESLDARARAYLDANCSHCHSDVGPADTSGLDLRPDVPFGPAYGACKSPIASGGGSGGRLYDIVPGKPEDSIFVYRMETTKPGHMMPELGRSLTHEEGVALIAEWIRAMEGACG